MFACVVTYISFSCTKTSRNGLMMLTGCTMPFVDLGKKLLEAAKLGQIETVQFLLLNGALFTTDWVNFESVDSLVLLLVEMHQ